MSRPILILISALALAACAPWTRQDQPPSPPQSVTLAAGQNLGQTFVARHAGLNGIDIYLAPPPQPGQVLNLTLFPDPQSDQPQASARLTLQESAPAGFFRFDFPALSDSRGKYYYARLELGQPTGAIQVGSGPGSGYLNGALYQTEIPLDAQMAFRTVYDPWLMSLGMLRLALDWLGVLLVAAALFLVPGLALLRLFWPADRPLHGWEAGILACGVGLALYPVLFLLTDLIGLHPGRLYAWGPPLLGGGYLLYDRLGKTRAESRADPSDPRQVSWTVQLGSGWRSWWRSPSRWPDLAAAVLFALLAAGRLYPVAGLEAPMWGDSYQHSLITQLIFEEGGLFDSWQPYAEMTAFTYHFGFHAGAAVYGWLSGVSGPQAVLWHGQILNLLAVVGLYPLATRLSGSRWGGLATVLVAGAFSPMPMAYINWGRYTQLAGQAVLPAAVLLGWEILERRQVDWRLTALGWVIWGGLALSHYRVLIFASLFIPSLLLLHFFIRRNRLSGLLSRLFWLVLGAGLLFLPWFLHLFAGRIIDMLASQLTTPPQSASVWQANNAIDPAALESYLPAWLWGIAGLAAAWGLLRRTWSTALVLVWWGLVVLATNPHWIGLPGVGALSNFAVVIAAYIPAGLLAGILAGGLMRARARESLRIEWVAALAVIILGAWGARLRLGDVDPGAGALVTRPDVRAAAWVDANLPPLARFHVNQFFAFSDSVTVGSDGGWWLPLLARRGTDLPPINYGFERPPRPDYPQWVNALPRLIQDLGMDDPQVLAEFKARGITHVYLGQRQGTVGYSGLPLLQADRLQESPFYEPVYNQDRVWIFRILFP